jgi:uncharacterized SAM-binding protein YcdF (DUF218 family)
MSFHAIVVLGCRVEGLRNLSGASARRVARAARAYREGAASTIVASGGKRWRGITEASAFTEALVREGVPRERIVLEERSLSTVGNARYVAELAREQNLFDLCIVTCDWHMARARAAFARHGLNVTALPAPAPDHGRVRRSVRELAERVQTVTDRIKSAWEHLR